MARLTDRAQNDLNVLTGRKTEIKPNQTRFPSGNHNILLKLSDVLFESRYEKTCFWHMRTTKAQISLRMRTVDQRFVVRCLDSIIPLLTIAEISKL